MYTYPLGSIISRHGLKYHIYADDTQIYFAIETGVDLNVMVSRTADCIKELMQWLAINMLQLNSEKSEFIIFTPKSMTDLTTDITLHLDDIVISPKGQVRSLGIHLDNSLKMDHHINYLCKVCIFQLRNICRISKYLTTNATKTIVHSLVISRLDYGNSTLCGVSDYLVAKLQKIQTFAARIIIGVTKYQHVTPALMELHWLLVRQRIKYKVLTLTYQMIHGLAPSYLCEMLTLYIPGRKLRLAESLLLCPPKCRTVTYGNKSFDLGISCTLWNSLPKNLRETRSLSCFKSSLRLTFLKKHSCPNFLLFYIFFLLYNLFCASFI